MGVRSRPTPPRSYKMGDLLAEGDHRVVVVASRRDDPERQVVLKLISRHAPERMKNRFREESVLRSQLQHPGISPILECGQTPEGVLYASSPYVDSQRIEEWVSADPVRRFLPVAEKLCEAVAFLHERGFLHGDIKPENILFQAEGEEILELQLTDFLPPLFGKADRFGTITGTLEYMAPETIRGQSADHRTDLYSLGITFYEFLRGSVPFTGEATEIARRHLDEIPDWEDVPKDVPKLWWLTIEKMLQKSPADRPQSAIDVLSDLTGKEWRRRRVAVPPAPHFVGRESVIEQFDAWRQEAASPVFAVTGERGSGRSRLLQLLATTERLAGSTVYALAVPASRESRPYGGLSLLVNMLTDGVSSWDVRCFLPHGGEVSEEKRGTRGEEVALFRNIEDSLLKILADAGDRSDRPALLIVDDYEHLDRSSRRFLRFLLDRERPGPLRLVLSTLRPENGAIPSVLEPFHLRGLVQIAPLSRFSEEEVYQYLRGMLGPGEFSPELIRQASRISGRLPSRLSLLVHEWVKRGAIRRRYDTFSLSKKVEDTPPITDENRSIPLGELDPTERLLAAAIASAPAPVTGPHLRRLLKISDMDWTRAIRPLVDRLLVSIESGNEGDVFLPRSEEIRAGLTGAVSQDELTRIHKLASRLSREGERKGVPGALMVTAHHLEKVGSIASACQKYIEGAQEFEELYAFSDAADVYRRVIRLGQGRIPTHAHSLVLYRLALVRNRIGESRAALAALRLLALKLAGRQREITFLVRGERLRGWILFQMGRVQDAERIFSRLRRHETAVPASEWATVLRDRSWVVMRSGNYEEAWRDLERALALLKGKKEPLLRGQIYNRMGGALFLRGELKNAESCFRRSLRALEKSHPSETPSPLSNLALIARSRDNLDKAAALLRKASGLAAQSSDILEEGRIQEDLAGLLHRLGEWGDAERAFTQAERTYREYGEESRSLRVYIGRSQMAIDRGRLDEALRLADRAVIEANRAGAHPQIRFGGLMVLARCHMARGEMQSAHDVLSEGKAIADSAPGDRLKGYALIQLGRYHQLNRQWHEVEETLGRAMEIAREGEEKINMAEILLLQAESALNRNRSGEAREKLDELDRLAKRQRNPLLSGRLAMLHGRACDGKRRNEAEARHFQNAVRIFTKLGARIDRALAHSYYGAVSLRRGERRKAKRHIEEAKRLYGLVRYASPPAFLPELIAAVSPQSDGMGEAFRLICRIAEGINTLRDSQKILEFVLDKAVEYLGADRGLILLQTADGGLEMKVARSLEGGDLDDVTRFSKTLLLESQRSSVPIVFDDTGTDRRLKKTKSIDAYNILSVITAPLQFRGEPIGVIYLDNCHRAGVFHEPDKLFLRALADQTTLAIKNARLMEDLEQENADLRREVTSGTKPGEIVGRSAAINSVVEKSIRAATSDISVLIEGETGTGKELVARLIHEKSARSETPFDKLNIAALPTELIESHLFGHEPGAFTDAKERKIGYFEKLDGGTLFLDEIGDLPLAAQPKLLRVLQEGEFQRLGSTQTIRVDVRIIAATRWNLKMRIAKNQFREDLYYRLARFTIEVPPLNRRIEDVDLLARHFLDLYSRQNDKRVDALSDEVIRCLRVYDWPGNVRELANAIERAVVVCGGSRIELVDLPDTVREAWVINADGARKGRGLTLPEAVAQFEGQLLQNALSRTSWNQSLTARLLGIHEATIRKKMRKYGLDRDPNRS